MVGNHFYLRATVTYYVPLQLPELSFPRHPCNRHAVSFHLPDPTLHNGIRFGIRMAELEVSLNP